MKLYIIGNGFDLAHNLKTKYSDYRNYIETNLIKNANWNIIKEYYPSNYDFWSDAETNVCKISCERYYQFRRFYGDFDDLDDLANAISESFNKFVLNVNASIENKSKKFCLEKDSLYLTFNYTETLEMLYGIPKERIIHIHNSSENAAMKEIFGLSDIGCILGHSQELTGFNFYSEGMIGHAKDYGKFIQRTTKPSDRIIKKFELEKRLVLISQKINEVVYYGFSFSPSDRPYLKLILLYLNPKAIKHTIYVHSETTDIYMLKKQLMLKIGFCGGNIDDMNVVNDRGITKI